MISWFWARFPSNVKVVVNWLCRSWKTASVVINRIHRGIICIFYCPFCYLSCISYMICPASVIIWSVLHQLSLICPASVINRRIQQRSQLNFYLLSMVCPAIWHLHSVVSRILLHRSKGHRRRSDSSVGLIAWSFYLHRWDCIFGFSWQKRSCPVLLSISLLCPAWSASVVRSYYEEGKHWEKLTSLSIIHLKSRGGSLKTQWNPAC